MEREVTKGKTRKAMSKIMSDVIFLLDLFGLFTVLLFHKIVPFFPILFLFDFCFLVGYPLFLRYVLKKKWFERTKDNYLALKYILLPWLIMELVVLLYYHEETFFIIKTIIENSN